MIKPRHHNFVPAKEYDYRDSIHEALSNEQYVQYACGEGPLTVDEVPDALRTSQAFHEFIEEFGWPDVADGAIEPLPDQDREFDSAAAGGFVERFLSLDYLDASRNLNNFKVWLTSVPHERSYLASADMYGANPALHRLYVLMPDLMVSLRMLLTEIETRHRGERGGMVRELSADANSEIVKVIMIVHEIAARLLKVDDMRRQQLILFPGTDPTMPDITDAHIALTQ